jgi:hypothetical protein
MRILEGDAPADRAIKDAGGIVGIWDSHPLVFQLADGTLLGIAERSAHRWALGSEGEMNCWAEATSLEMAQL